MPKAKSDAHYKFLNAFERTLGRHATRTGVQLALILDWDGTLAPIVEDPKQAYAHDGVLELLGNLLEVGARPVISTGRVWTDIYGFLGELGEKVEIWASHGKARKVPSLAVEHLPVPAYMQDGLMIARDEMARLGLGSDLEIKEPYGFAVHWRSLVNAGKSEAAEERAVEARRVFELVAPKFGLRIKPGDMVLEIEAGIEGGTKQRVVKTICKEYRTFGANPRTTFIAGFGDDRTDEDMFVELNRQGNTPPDVSQRFQTLSVLVRQRRATTAAKAFLETPEELKAFLLRSYEILRGRRR